MGDLLDPYMAFITETLERFPTLTAARLFDMVKARGYMRRINQAAKAAASMSRA